MSSQRSINSPNKKVLKFASNLNSLKNISNCEIQSPYSKNSLPEHQL